jgi:translation initiation factor 4A
MMEEIVEIVENTDNEINNNCYNDIKSWDDLDLNPDILRGIYGYGFENPSPIQCKSIKPIIERKDIIAQAQSGTGKTAAFTIGSLSLVDLNKKDIQIVILSPTRELTIQTSKVIENLSSMMKGLKVHNLIGGTSIDEDSHTLRKNTPHIICGCSGRVYDMMRRNHNLFKKVKMIVLDEADEMLSIGFKDQVYNILQNLPVDVQVALFSATLPDHIQVLTEKFMRNPVKIYVKTESLTLEGISQYFVGVDDDKQKYITLKNIFSFISMSQCIIYCNTVKRVKDLYDAMIEDGFPVCCIHSGMDKTERYNAFNDFRLGKQRVLISSNVTARGIDVQQVSVVINFDLPKCIHTYLHRIGRSGRWGRKGVGINFITRRDINKIKEIEQHYCTQIDELPTNLNILAQQL